MTITTKSQAERLVFAGVSPKTSDCSFVHTENHVWFQYGGEVHEAEDRIAYSPGYGFPAWSLSALWDLIHSLDRTYDFGTNMSAEELIETLVTVICCRFTQTPIEDENGNHT